MVLTNQQTTDFFTTEMGIPEATVTQLATMGIVRVEDLVDYDEDLIKSLKDDLRKPTGTMPDPNDATRVVPQAPYILTPLSCKKLVVAAKTIAYYQATGYNVTLGSLRWGGPLTLFSQYLKALKVQKAEDNKEPPKVSRSLPIGQWSEAFQIFLEKALGVRDIPLAYVIRQDAVPPAAPTLRANRPYSAVHESVVKELIARASHTHTLYENDNEEVYNHLELALRTTQYAATLSPFKRRKNGRDAWFAIIAQYIGKDKWQKEVKKQELFLHTFVWKGNSNLPLETFVNKHRTAFVRIQQCAEHITHTIPSAEQQVRYLLDGIQSSEPQLLAALGNVRADDGENGKMSDFEATAAYIIPFDPVTTKRSQKRKLGKDYDISAVDMGITKGEQTGVEVRFYKPNEYRQLSDEQKMELLQLRKQNKSRKKIKGGGGKPTPKPTPKEDKAADKAAAKKEKLLDRMIAAFETNEKEAEEQKTNEQFTSAVVPAINNISLSGNTQQIAAIKSSLPSTQNEESNPGTKAKGVNQLKSILKRTNNK
jgi:hypothetical protein